jgi:hypothetical protein
VDTPPVQDTPPTADTPPALGTDTTQDTPPLFGSPNTDSPNSPGFGSPDSTNPNLGTPSNPLTPSPRVNVDFDIPEPTEDDGGIFTNPNQDTDLFDSGIAGADDILGGGSSDDTARDQLGL